MSWVITYLAVVVQNHYHFDMPYEPRTTSIFFLVSFAVFIVYSNDIPSALKTMHKQKLIIDRQNSEFNQILSSLPQGIMLVTLRARSEIIRLAQEIEDCDGIDQMTVKQELVLPYEAQYLNKELKDVMYSEGIHQMLGSASEFEQEFKKPAAI